MGSGLWQRENPGEKPLIAATRGLAAGSLGSWWGRKSSELGQAAFVHLQPQIRGVFEIVKSLPGVTIFREAAEPDEYLAARRRMHEEQR